MEKDRFVLIDGHAILHRAYHALPHLTNRTGESVNAVYGFVTMLFRIISDLKPKYLAVAFDTEKPTFRQAEYIGYQAQRPKMEEELKGQIGKVYEVLRAMGIPIFQKEGFEADDVIGTLVKKTAKKKKEVVIVTGDRDMFQLVDANTKVYVPLRGLSEAKLFGEEEVEKEIGIKPFQIPDFKALVGDASDNYPGVPGIGPRTARELLKRFRTLEEIYQKFSQVRESFSPRVATLLLEGRESAFLSRKLATIVCSLPLDFNLERCLFSPTTKNKERTIEKFKELSFKSLIPRLNLIFGGESIFPKKKDKTEEQLKML